MSLPVLSKASPPRAHATTFCQFAAKQGRTKAPPKSALTKDCDLEEVNALASNESGSTYFDKDAAKQQSQIKPQKSYFELRSAHTYGSLFNLRPSNPYKSTIYKKSRILQKS